MFIFIIKFNGFKMFDQLFSLKRNTHIHENCLKAKLCDHIGFIDGNTELFL